MPSCFRRKKAQAEAHKLEHIQKELAKLDNLLTADVQVIRHKIEGSSRDFLEAQYVQYTQILILFALEILKGVV